MKNETREIGVRKVYKWLVGVAVGGGLLLWVCLNSLPDGRLHVFVLDIGQGDSILVQTPSDEYMLIDGGPDDKVMQQLGRVMPFYEHTIDIIILTHPHADHVNGLVDVVERYHVREIMMTGVVYYSPGYIAFLEEIGRQKIPVIWANAAMGDFQLGAVTLDMLHPLDSAQGRSFDNVHASMVVFRLLYGERSFMFTGDMEMDKEAMLAEGGFDLRADFLKVGHHGSETSTTADFLRAVQPQYAAISCGVDNKFKHPRPVTMQNLMGSKVKIYRTDLDGIIEAVSDGMNLAVKRFGK